MSEHPHVVVSRHDTARGTLASYVAGYIFSIYLTITAYLAVYNHLFSNTLLAVIIVGLALVQFVGQLLFFMHLGKETKPRWKLAVTLSMILVVSILVGGSLWIMSNLNYRMTPTQQQNYMNNQQGL
jgi:cytochrome o ubiquinol oxidase operon protein cyoD